MHGDLVKFVEETNKKITKEAKEKHPDYYKWAAPGWWEEKEEEARNMDDAALLYSLEDARKARDVMDKNVRSGGSISMENSYGRYADEVHIYAGELRKRRGSR